MELFTTFYRSPIGMLRIRGTDHYIQEIHFIDNDDEITGETAQLPDMAIQCTEQLIQYFQGMRRIFDFPVSQTGTDFQQKVWYELMNIPFGRTISYLELSRRLGDPKAIRAAASANGKNQLAIVVPCHRVVGSKNDLVGYAGVSGEKNGCLIWNCEWHMACKHFSELSNLPERIILYK
jgi:methylated-DNA-[protein]-cysteine S-methyltransferase